MNERLSMRLAVVYHCFPSRLMKRNLLVGIQVLHTLCRSIGIFYIIYVFVKTESENSVFERKELKNRIS